MVRREPGCPLCGARLTAPQLLDACSGLLDATLGVLEACCPFCQGHLEVRPVPGRVELGYLADAGTPRFDMALSLPCPELAVLHLADGGLALAMPERRWDFRP